MRATVACFPGSMNNVEIADQQEGRLAELLARAGIAGWDPAAGTRDVAVNGEIVTDPELMVPDGAKITVSERVRGA